MSDRSEMSDRIFRGVKRVPNEFSDTRGFLGHRYPLYRTLLSIDQKLADMYLAGIQFPLRRGQPDYLAHSAHSLRELMEKLLPKAESTYNLGNEVNNLRESWRNYRNDQRSPVQTRDDVVACIQSSFLKKIDAFFEKYEAERPMRRKRHSGIFRHAGAGGTGLPKAIANFNYGLWIKINDCLQDVAHHRSNRINSEDDFAQIVDKLDELLANLLAPRIFERIDIIDQIVGTDDPTSIPENTILELLAHPVNFRYFFEHVPAGPWVIKLESMGFFKDPHEYEEAEDGNRYIPRWPPSEYLKRAAANCPNDVARIISTIDTVNPFIVSDFLETVISLPCDLASKWVDLHTKTLKKLDSFPDLCVDSYIKMIVNKVTCEDLSVFLRLLGELLSFKTEKGTQSEYLQIDSKFSDWAYGKLLSETVDSLVQLRTLGVLRTLCSVLNSAITLEKSDSEADDDSYDFSHVWRPAIEDSEQNSDRDARSLLVRCIRNLCNSILEGKEISSSELLGVLAEYPSLIFTRIKLYLLTVHEDLCIEAEEEIARKSNFDNPWVFHEYYHLLKQRFAYIDARKQDVILEWILAGPDVQDYTNRSESIRAEHPSSSDVERYVATWQVRRISAISHIIPKRWASRVDPLIQKGPPPKHPDSLSYHESSWGHHSPLTQGELEKMSLDEIVSFLNNWTPDRKVFAGSTSEGLSRILKTVVSKRPHDFIEGMDCFLEHAVDPTYVRSLIEGLQDALKEGTEVSWLPVAKFCLNIVKLSKSEIEIRIGDRDDDADQDTGWSWTLKSIAGLIQRGLASEQNSIPHFLSDEIWQILEYLLGNSDPDVEHEEQYGPPNMDAYTLSLNTIRGEAIHATLYYVLWHYRNDRGNTIAPDERFLSTNMYAVAEALATRLRLETDMTQTTRAAIASWLPKLIALDEEWVRQNLSGLFPDYTSHPSLWMAAWHSFLFYAQNSMSERIFHLLSGVYRQALSILGTAQDSQHARNDWQLRLGQQLIIYYLHDCIGLDAPDGMLEQYFSLAPLDVRKQTLEFAGRLIDTPEDLTDEEVNKLMNLWEWRIQHLNDDVMRRGELTSFSFWFPQRRLPVRWALEHLCLSIQRTSEFDDYTGVFERLVETIGDMPDLTLECLELILHAGKPQWTISMHINDISEILSRAISSENPDVRDKAVSLVHGYGAKGYTSLRCLLTDQEGN